MKKEDLAPGDLIVTKVTFANTALFPGYYHEVPYMLEDIYGEGKKYFTKDLDRSLLLEKSHDWCFRVHRNFPATKVLQVSYFDRSKNYVARSYYQFGNFSFNTYSEFFLRYEDINLIVEPVCDDCYNYCRQLCFKDLKIWK